MATGQETKRGLKSEPSINGLVERAKLGDKSMFAERGAQQPRPQIQSNQVFRPNANMMRPMMPGMMNFLERNGHTFQRQNHVRGTPFDQWFTPLNAGNGYAPVTAGATFGTRMAQQEQALKARNAVESNAHNARSLQYGQQAGFNEANNQFNTNGMYARGLDYGPMAEIMTRWARWMNSEQNPNHVEGRAAKGNLLN